MMNRRKALALIPAAAALLSVRNTAAAAPIPAAAANAAGFATSVQLWSFKEFTLFEAVEKSAAAGASGVELYPGQKIGGEHGDLKFDPSLPDDKLQAVIDHLKKNNVAAVNFGVTGIDKDEAKARVVFEFAKKLGLYGLTTESTESLDTLEKLSKEYDIKICFHNHPKPTKLWNPDDTLKLLEGRHANLGFCADVGHMATSGMNPLDVVKRIAPRIHSFHMKDRAEIGKPTHDDIFGTGVIDIYAILDVAIKAGFKGNVSMEYEYNWKNNITDIAQNIGYLRAYAKNRKG
jgi:sugar phosphate isomerase/epimerase